MFTAARLAPALKSSARAFSTSRVAADVSKVTLVGRLGADPTLRTTKDDKPYYTYVVATSGPPAKDATGAFVDPHTSWHTVFSFSEAQHPGVSRLTKGSTVYVEADLEMRESEPIDGQPVPPRVLLRQLSLRPVARSQKSEPAEASSE